MKSSTTKTQNSPWQIASITAVIIGLAFLLIGMINQQRLQKYRHEGITVEARITDKSDEGQTCIGVSFFDKDLLDGGVLYLTQICDFVSNDIWRSARVGGHEMMVFLPEDPENLVIFAASLENSQSPAFSIGGVLFGIGVLALGWPYIKNKQTK
jgi:hypothetical protein